MGSAASRQPSVSGMPMTTCRDAVIEDGEALAQVWVEAWQAAYAGLMPAEYLAGLDAESGLERFEQAIRAGISILALEQDGSLVGFSCYGSSRDADADTGEVIAINLRPSHWRRGLGRALLGETVRRLRERGFSEVTLWVLQSNARARHFYEALGWLPDGGERHDDKLTGFPLQEVRYRRRLP